MGGPGLESTHLKEGLAQRGLEGAVFLECFHHCLPFPCLPVKERTQNGTSTPAETLINKPRLRPPASPSLRQVETSSGRPPYPSANTVPWQQRPACGL